MLDETTDIKTTPLLAICIRHYVESDKDFTDDILSLIEVQDTTADTLFEGYVHKYSISYIII